MQPGPDKGAPAKAEASEGNDGWAGAWEGAAAPATPDGAAGSPGGKLQGAPAAAAPGSADAPPNPTFSPREERQLDGFLTARRPHDAARSPRHPRTDRYALFCLPYPSVLQVPKCSVLPQCRRCKSVYYYFTNDDMPVRSSALELRPLRDMQSGSTRDSAKIGSYQPAVDAGHISIAAVVPRAHPPSPDRLAVHPAATGQPPAPQQAAAAEDRRQSHAQASPSRGRPAEAGGDAPNRGRSANAGGDAGAAGAPRGEGASFPAGRGDPLGGARPRGGSSGSLDSLADSDSRRRWGLPPDPRELPDPNQNPTSCNATLN